MKDLFRTALNKLARDVKYQLERAKHAKPAALGEHGRSIRRTY